MALPTLVILVRHAQSEHHVRGLTGGWTDTPLTDIGHEQSRRVAARLKAELGNTPIALHTSDLRRAMQTAEHIAAAFGVDPAADPRLREWNNGDAVNMTLDQARDRFPGVFDVQWRLDDRPFPGGETLRELCERTSRFIDELRAGGTTPVVVSHGASIECMIARWLMLTPEALEPVGFSTHTTGITTLTRDRFDHPLIERMNDVSHLYGTEGAFGLGQLIR